jgi:hypothetical protein
MKNSLPINPRAATAIRKIVPGEATKKTRITGRGTVKSLLIQITKFNEKKRPGSGFTPLSGQKSKNYQNYGLEKPIYKERPIEWQK